MEEDRSYYVYEHIRLDNFTPFYIGKGKGNRGDDLERNKHHDRISEKHGHAVVIIKDGLTEEEALELEKDIIEDLVFNEGYGINIKSFRNYNSQEDNYLTNSTWGGEGVSGYTHTEEDKQKMSEAMKGKPKSEETKQKMSEAMKGENNPNYGKKGENNPFFGKHHTEETKLKISEGNKGKHISEETKQKMSEAMKGENNPNYGKKGENHPRAKAVYCYEKNEIRLTVKEWSEELCLHRQHISQCCTGRQKSTGGYHFRYATEEEIEEYKNNLKLKESK